MTETYHSLEVKQDSGLGKGGPNVTSPDKIQREALLESLEKKFRE